MSFRISRIEMDFFENQGYMFSVLVDFSYICCNQVGFI